MQLTLTTLLFQRRYRQPWYEEIFYDITGRNIISIVIAVLLLSFIISLFKKTLKEYHSRWNTLIDNFEFSSQEFYTMLREEYLIFSSFFKTFWTLLISIIIIITKNIFLAR